MAELQNPFTAKNTKALTIKNRYMQSEHQHNPKKGRILRQSARFHFFSSIYLFAENSRLIFLAISSEQSQRSESFRAFFLLHIWIRYSAYNNNDMLLGFFIHLSTSAWNHGLHLKKEKWLEFAKRLISSEELFLLYIFRKSSSCWESFASKPSRRLFISSSVRISSKLYTPPGVDASLWRGGNNSLKPLSEVVKRSLASITLSVNKWYSQRIRI